MSTDEIQHFLGVFLMIVGNTCMVRTSVINISSTKLTKQVSIRTEGQMAEELSKLDKNMILAFLITYTEATQ